MDLIPERDLDIMAPIQENKVESMGSREIDEDQTILELETLIPEVPTGYLIRARARHLMTQIMEIMTDMGMAMEIEEALNFLELEEIILVM